MKTHSASSNINSQCWTCSHESFRSNQKRCWCSRIKPAMSGKSAGIQAQILLSVTPIIQFRKDPEPRAARHVTYRQRAVDTALVLDFENRSGLMGEMLSRLATDAVAVELAATNRYEVIRRD